MNICVLIDSYNDANGATIATKRLVNGLRERGHQISIVSALHEKPEDPYFHQVKGFVLPGAEASQENMKFLFARGDKRVYRKAMAEADIALIQFPFLMAPKAVKVAKRLGIPIVGSFHVQPQNIMAALGKTSKRLEKIMWFFFRYLMLKRVKTIIAPSPFAKKLLEENKVRARIRPISNGIPKKYKPMDFDRPAFFGDKLVLFNIGRHAAEKRQSLLIEGVRKSRYADKILLMLAGRGEMTDELKEKGKDLPVAPFVEYISEEDKLKYLNTADLFIHGSIVELESLSCLEAIGCGLPCLIADSKYSAAPQFAMDERFLFKSDDADSLAESLNYWYEHREEIQGGKMKDEVLAMAESYRFEKVLDEYEMLLMEQVKAAYAPIELYFKENTLPAYVDEEEEEDLTVIAPDGILPETDKQI